MHLFSGLSTSSQLKEHHRAYYSSYPTTALPQNPTDTHIQKVNPDNCSICGSYLIEIKCTFSHQNLHPSSALQIGEKNGDELEITKQHLSNSGTDGNNCNKKNVFLLVLQTKAFFLLMLTLMKIYGTK